MGEKGKGGWGWEGVEAFRCSGWWGGCKTGVRIETPEKLKAQPFRWHSSCKHGPCHASIDRTRKRQRECHAIHAKLISFSVLLALVEFEPTNMSLLTTDVSTMDREVGGVPPYLFHAEVDVARQQTTASSRIPRGRRQRSCGRAIRSEFNRGSCSPLKPLGYPSQPRLRPYHYLRVTHENDVSHDTPLLPPPPHHTTCPN